MTTSICSIAAVARLAMGLTSVALTGVKIVSSKNPDSIASW
jgi:hypothetical protein